LEDSRKIIKYVKTNVAFSITIRTRSSKYFGSIGDEAADLNSSLFKPCQIPSKVLLIVLPDRAGEVLGDL
jgi:hypothetical protein